MGYFSAYANPLYSTSDLHYTSDLLARRFKQLIHGVVAAVPGHPAAVLATALDPEIVLT